MTNADAGNSKKVEEHPSAKPHAVVHLHLGRGWLIGAGVLLVLTWGLVVGAIWLRPAPPAPPAGPTGVRPASLPYGPVRCRSGPWGELDCLAITTEPPDDFVSLTYLKFSDPRWAFKDYTHDRLLELFKTAALTDSESQSLLRSAEWTGGSTGCVITPEDSVVMGLTAKARAEIYAALSADPDNHMQNEPFRFRADCLDEWFEGSGLSGRTVELVKRLTYQRGLSVLFSDTHLVLPTLPAAQERIRLLKTLARQPTVLLTLRIRPDTDVSAIADYWGKGGTAKDLKPLLESLTKVPDGCELDVVHLLPRFARERLHTYPALGSPESDRRHDCHWSSMNFWNDPPEDRFFDTTQVAQVLETQYAPVTGDHAFGDVILFMASDTAAIHSAVYIADDIVFTKNGPSIRAPWTLQRLPNLIAYYQANTPLALRAYRLKAWPMPHTSPAGPPADSPRQ